mmetsp:Transcript_19638/g.69536  ORF Transcript_19638/g.69536 Transcript_19638/m.69536 type:complete len:99 (+) Transcript_19638:174-470(+)
MAARGGVTSSELALEGIQVDDIVDSDDEGSYDGAGESKEGGGRGVSFAAAAGGAGGGGRPKAIALEKQRSAESVTGDVDVIREIGLQRALRGVKDGDE